MRIEQNNKDKIFSSSNVSTTFEKIYIYKKNTKPNYIYIKVNKIRKNREIFLLYW